VEVHPPTGDDGAQVLEDVHSGHSEALDRTGGTTVELDAYGHRWWRLRVGV
jgi:hypothetical protein